jgi:hypothetical protein
MKVGERFEHWMQTETSYALSKFGPDEQYPYWEAGITRGSFSFRSSALNYMRRAVLAAEGVAVMPELGLKVVQNLGKAAHNLVAMDATATAYHAGRTGQIAAGFDRFYELSSDLFGTAPVGRDDILAAEENRRRIFTELQSAQDSGNIGQFHDILGPELHFAAQQFVSAAELYGWVVPGRTSGEIVSWK